MKNVFSGKKAVLFDLDGVVLDTESQYTLFWKGLCKDFFPDDPGLGLRIKGMTLDQIFDRYFPYKRTQDAITERVNRFEASMRFNYIEGFTDFINELKQLHLRTALVTSSNKEKMSKVFRQHPEFPSFFDRILTSEDFKKSKPAPDCYLQAASLLCVEPGDSVGIEDSFNGLKSLQAAHITSVGFATTNAAADIAPLATVVVNNFLDLLPMLKNEERESNHQ